MSRKKSVSQKKRAGRPPARARDRPLKGKRIGEILADKYGKYFEKITGADWKKILSQNFPYVLCGYFGNKLSCLYQETGSGDAFHRVMMTMERLDRVFDSLIPSINPKDLFFGAACGAALKTAVYIKRKNAKKYRHGVEYGSARWGNAKDIEPYMDSVFENNILLTQTERLMMSGRPKQPKYARNKNILVIGGSGSGKTRFFVKPSAPVRAA